MDSTLIPVEVIDELAAAAGCGEHVALITARAMAGELDFIASFRERLGLLNGLSLSAVQRVEQNLSLADGADKLAQGLKAAGVYTVILSGGFDRFAKAIATRLKFNEFHANRLEIKQGVVSGQVLGDIVDAEYKRQKVAALTEQLGIPPAQVMAVGDGANDIPMLKFAGFGVALHAKPTVQQQADLALNHHDMSNLLYLL